MSLVALFICGMLLQLVGPLLQLYLDLPDLREQQEQPVPRGLLEQQEQQELQVRHQI